MVKESLKLSFVFYSEHAFLVFSSSWLWSAWVGMSNLEVQG